MDIKKYNFLNKVRSVGGKNCEVSLKCIKKDGEILKNKAIGRDNSGSIIVISKSAEKIFYNNFVFGNIGAFLKAMEEYETYEERDNEFLFKDDKRKVVFKKHSTDDDDGLEILKKFDKNNYKETIKDYIKISLTVEEIEEIKKGFSYSSMSEYLSLIIKDGYLIMKIGNFENENTFELKVKEIPDSPGEEIKILTSLKNFMSLINSFNTELEENDVNLYIYTAKDNSGLLFVTEKNFLSDTRYFICLSDEGDDFDE